MKKKAPLEPLFVVRRGGDVLLFKNPYDAEKDLSARSLIDGDYLEAFTLTGQVVSLGIEGKGLGRRVKVTWTGRDDRARLVARLRVLAERNGRAGEDPRPEDVANEVWANEWRVRWPTRPRWLDRRLHGDGPAQV